MRAVESSRYTQIEAVLADFDKYITYNKSGIKSMKNPTIAYTAVAGNYYESIGDFQKALDNAISAANNDSGGKTPSKKHRRRRRRGEVRSAFSRRLRYLPNL